jgi:hypothetical protein
VVSVRGLLKVMGMVLEAEPPPPPPAYVVDVPLIDDV